MICHVGLVILIVMIIRVESQATEVSLRRDLFNRYDPSSRPVTNASEIITVCAGLYILQIVGLNEKSQIMQANIQLVFIWNDSYLKWNASDYGNIKQLYVKSSLIWTPDIIIMDSAEEKTARGYRDHYLILVNSRGTIRWQYQTLSKSFCEIDIMNFPFDEQTCSINIRSSARDKNMFKIIKRNTKVKVMENIRTEWFITNSSVLETSLQLSQSFDNAEYTVLKFTLKLRRVPTYYFLKIIFPFSIIASITLFTFWLAPDSGEKLTLDITILLSLVFYLQIISDYIPRGFSKIPILTLFTLTNFFLVFLSCVFTVMVLRLYYKTPTFLSSIDNQMPYLLRLVLFKYIAPLLLLKFYCRKRGELYSNKSRLAQNKKLEDLEDQKSDDRGLAELHQEYISLTPKKNDHKIVYKNVTKKDMDFYAYNLSKLSEQAEKSIRSENVSNADTPKELLKTLRVLNKCIVLNNKLKNVEDIDANKKEKSAEQAFYYEEWKQASLVLDRLFFYIFLICMPLTTVVFLRSEVLAYINSVSQSNVNITNINCL